MTKPLSPAAQAVLNAMVDVVCTPPISLDEPPPSTLATKLMGAAALRAAADQVVPDEPDFMRSAIPDTGWWEKQDSVRDEILAIAAELAPNPDHNPQPPGPF